MRNSDFKSLKTISELWMRFELMASALPVRSRKVHCATARSNTNHHHHPSTQTSKFETGPVSDALQFTIGQQASKLFPRLHLCMFCQSSQQRTSLQAVQGLVCRVLVPILLPYWRAVQGDDGSALPAAVIVLHLLRQFRDGSVQLLVSHVFSPTDILHHP